MSTTTVESDWISLSRARELTGVGPMTLKRLIDEGLISVRKLPGGRPRLRRSDVETLLATHTQNARISRQ
jgi:excisionase family DNA binding protein